MPLCELKNLSGQFLNTFTVDVEKKCKNSQIT